MRVGEYSKKSRMFSDYDMDKMQKQEIKHKGWDGLKDSPYFQKKENTNDTRTVGVHTGEHI